MKIYNNQKEVDKDLINNTLKVNGDVKFRFDVIKRFNIKAYDIFAGDINALNIICKDINTGNIKAYDIDANKISYYDSCIAYQNITCSKITGRSANSFHKCLYGKLIIKED